MARSFYATIDRANSAMYGRVWNDDTDSVEFEKIQYVGQISGSSEQRLRSSLAMDALDWATGQNIDPHSIEDLGDYINIDKWK